MYSLFSAEKTWSYLTAICERERCAYLPWWVTATEERHLSLVG